VRRATFSSGFRTVVPSGFATTSVTTAVAAPAASTRKRSVTGAPLGVFTSSRAVVTGAADAEGAGRAPVLSASSPDRP